MVVAIKKALEDVSALVAIVAKDTGALVMSDPDEDSVGSTLEGDLEMTFGHVRRAHQALTTIEALQRENEVLKQHVEELQEKIDPEKDCACSYDEAGAVCGAHSPMLKAAEAEEKRLREALEPFATVSEKWVNDGGWTELACKNDRIVDWFGATDFLRASTALASAGEHHAE